MFSFALILPAYQTSYADSSIVSVLVVAGGAGGGNGGGAGAGGGGAGGFRYEATYAVAAGPYSVTVGDGGDGAVDYQ